MFFHLPETRTCLHLCALKRIHWIYPERWAPLIYFETLTIIVNRDTPQADARAQLFLALSAFGQKATRLLNQRQDLGLGRRAWGLDLGLEMVNGLPVQA